MACVSAFDLRHAVAQGWLSAVARRACAAGAVLADCPMPAPRTATPCHPRVRLVRLAARLPFVELSPSYQHMRFNTATLIAVAALGYVLCAAAMPHDAPIAHAEIDAMYEPKTEVLPDGRTRLFQIDVSGHGAAAALVSVMSHIAVKTALQQAAPAQRPVGEDFFVELGALDLLADLLGLLGAFLVPIWLCDPVNLC